ncbi:MAG: AraC family transcriptional regulator [Candidatus Methylacidiphilales bacterium]|nr:AraC family transcriptional regulator [Candidatus Methylacidiphilales bacterium]
MKDILLDLYAASPHEAAIHSSYHWDNHDRRPFSLILQYTWSGEGRLRRNKREQICGPGQAMMMRQGDPTTYYYPTDGTIPWEYSWINFVGAEALWGGLIQRYGDIVTLDSDGETIGLLRQITRLYHNKEFQDRYHTSELLVRLLSSLARELGQIREVNQSPVRHAQDYLRDHHRRPINIKEVAAQFGISREHFARMFHAETGKTPAVFLRELRLQTARRLLCGTNMPVRQVAEQSGFGSSTHFCRAFRIAQKMSPEAYRKNREQSARGKTIKRGDSRANVPAEAKEMPT